MDGLRARFLAPARDETSPEVSLGDRIRALRGTRGLSLQDLSESSGLSRGFLSQVEHNQVTPSVASLSRVAEALKVPLDSLFSAEPQGPKLGLVRAKDRVKLVYGSGSYSDEVLSPSIGGELLVLMSTIEPGATSGDEPYSHDSGREILYMIDGALEVEVEGETRTLEVGDALTFSSRRLHAWRNKGSTAARVLWLIAPRHR
jgi:transcriptional regulator with XRE-family HTH domain